MLLCENHNLNLLKFVEIEKSDLIKKEADYTVTLLSSGNLLEKGFTIKNIELREYIKRYDKKLGAYSLITSLVETDKGSIEMTYFVGYRGEEPLEKTREFLLNNLGLGGLILRSVISLEAHLKMNNS